jgi:predicted ATPase/class 3 adenylate cyclase/DNA-binding CsgD family transcriptional regulator
MSGLPAGAVTFVFSDIEGSTRLVKALRERYPQVLSEHRRLVRAAIAARGGREVDTQGDAFFAAFGTATQAVLCALDTQRALAAHRWPGGAQVRVRIGIHTGQAVPAGGAYTGLAVHRAARICAAARGGQVLVSQATQTLIEDEEEGEDLGFTLVDVGEHQLKDLDRPVRLFQLAAAGLEAPSVPGGGQGAGHPGGPGMGLAAGGAGPDAPGGAAAVVHGLPAALTSFIGRDEPVREVAGLLEEHRLVTVTGPGGSGKTRLACEVARQVAGRFADGAWLVELAPVGDPDQVAAVVATALGVREQPGMPIAGTLARVLARQQPLLVLDNCEHVLAAAAGLCAELLAACDDLRILATSREGLRVAGEARYRLGPLAVPDPEDLADAAGTEAVVLFADRARQADAHFALDGRSGPEVARLVARLDGMPLAIELAAARAEALGVSGLLACLEDRFALLSGGDRLAPPRQRSLAAAVEWSYQLLDEQGRRAFRAVSVFPGPFTLDAAEAVAGTGAGLAVLRLVDCSLVVPPRTGVDERPRYVMLDTLRAYGARLLAEAGEQDAVAAALAAYALRVAEEAAAGLQTATGEAAAARWLDAEDPTMRQVLAWAIARDQAAAVQLAVALGGWWRLRRRPGQYPLLSEIAGLAEPGSDGWCTIQFWLGWAALLAADWAVALGHFTAVRDAVQDRGPSRVLADVLAGRSSVLLNAGRLAEGAEDGRRSLAMARELGYPAGEGTALRMLAIAALRSGDYDGAVQLGRQQQLITGIPGTIARAGGSVMIGALIETGDLAAAGSACAAALAQCRDTGDMLNLPNMLGFMTYLHVQAGRFQDAAAHLREGLQTALRAGNVWGVVTNGLWDCAWLCTATGRYAEAATLWAARDAHARQRGLTAGPGDARREEQALRTIRQALGPARVRAAEERGAAMSLDTAAEYALMLTAPAPGPLGAAAGTRPGLGNLSARERELVTLVAQGRTDAQIAAQLYISVRTVHTHLDRIRDKTGCRRRADLTRLALHTGLI